MKILSNIIRTVARSELPAENSPLWQPSKKEARESFEAISSKKTSNVFVCVPNRLVEYKHSMFRVNEIKDGLSNDDFAEIPNKMPLLKSMREGEREKDQINNVVYLTKEQRASFELVAREGQLFRSDGIMPLDTKRFYNEHSLLYVISPSKKMYAARGASHIVHHSSFLAGKNVFAAGKIVTSNGKIIFISNNSGHYRPKAQHLLQAIKYFHELGVLSPDALIEIRNVGTSNLKESLELLKNIILSEQNSFVDER